MKIFFFQKHIFFDSLHISGEFCLVLNNFLNCPLTPSQLIAIFKLRRPSRFLLGQLLLDWPTGFLKKPVGVKLLKIDREIVRGQERGLVLFNWSILSWRSGIGKSCFQNKSWFVNNQLIRSCWFVCHVMVVCHLIADL